MMNDADTQTRMESDRDAGDVQAEEARADAANWLQTIVAANGVRIDDGHDELLLATDRIGTASLESLFTERTEADGEQEEESHETDRAEETQTDGTEKNGDFTDMMKEESVVDIAIEEASGDTDDPEDTSAFPAAEPPIRVDTGEMSISQQRSRASSPMSSSPPPQSSPSPSPPTVPIRPPRPATLAMSPLHLPTAMPPPPQLITFDVGGKLFRCKASLLHRYPTKRLHHIVSCGCDQIDHATFFIDRNPQFFERVLDWYRTGKNSLHPLPPHVNEDAFREDAKYYDLYDELFSIPSPAPVPPPRDKNPPRTPPATTTLPRLPARPARSHPVIPSFSPLIATPLPLKTQSPNGIVRYSKREVRSVSSVDAGAAPTWFCIKAHEHLLVESVKGSGKLLVRVTDESGMMQVLVDQAVLFDSRSWFYLENDGCIKLQHCILPGSHVYTFWMEPTSNDQFIPSLPPPQAKQPTNGKRQVATVAGTPALEVVFRIVSTFSRTEEMEADGALTAVLESHKSKCWGAPVLDQATTNNTRRDCLFLPPQQQQVVSTAVDTLKLPRDLDLDERDAIAEQIRALAARDRSSIQKTKPVQVPTLLPETKGSGSMTSTLKRNGAAIAHLHSPQKATSQHQRYGHGHEKVIVYRPVPLSEVTSNRRKPTPR